MKKYAVELTDATMAAIHAQARYISVDQQQPLNAQHWLEAAWDAVNSLETFPNRCPIAEENEDATYELRFILAGSTSLLFTVDEVRQTVWVIALRGDGQLPKPQSLPLNLDYIERGT